MNAELAGPFSSRSQGEVAPRSRDGLASRPACPGPEQHYADEEGRFDAVRFFFGEVVKAE